MRCCVFFFCAVDVWSLLRAFHYDVCFVPCTALCQGFVLVLCCVFDLVGSVCLCSFCVLPGLPPARNALIWRPSINPLAETTAAKAAQSPLGNEKRAHHETFSNSKGSSPPGLNIFYLKEIFQSQECSGMSNATNGENNVTGTLSCAR